MKGWSGQGTLWSNSAIESESVDPYLSFVSITYLLTWNINVSDRLMSRTRTSWTELTDDGDVAIGANNPWKNFHDPYVLVETTANEAGHGRQEQCGSFVEYNCVQ
jgi:hypothetical protein